MIYEEKNRYNKIYIMVAVLLLALMFAPVFLEMQELLSEEGLYLAAVREMNPALPLMKAQGDIVSGGFPLYPCLVQLLTNTGIPMIAALRLVPCICLLLLTGIIFLTAWKAKGLTAGIVGASVMLINFLTIEKFSDGTPVLLGTLGVFGAWMAWFALGVWRNEWKMAWVLLFLISGLTFMAIGFTGLFLIIFPMMFHRRPLMVWTKPRGKAFLAGIVILVLFILLWGIPRWTYTDIIAWERTISPVPSAGKYFTHLLTFPFDAAIRFMPWTLFVWAPFCPAIVPLDESPILSRYLRTLFLGTFTVLWLSPLTQSRDMFFLIPPLAVLIALNYWIVVRKYGWKLLRFFQLIAIALMIACTAAFSYLIFSREQLPSIISDHLLSMDDSPYRILCLIGSSAGIFFSILAVIMCIYGARVWLVIVVLSGALILPYRGLILPYQNLHKPKEYIGVTFRNAIPENETPDVVYRMYDIPPFYSEMHYFDIRLKTISSAEELPVGKPVVYVFSSVVPSAPDRTWERIYHQFYWNKKIELWRGKLKMEEDYE